jgi:hypothetical protein
MENDFEISIRLSSDDYIFGNDIKALDNYKIKIFKKGESIIPNKPNSTFRARANVLLVDNIYEKQFSNINIEDNYNKLIKLFDIIKNQFKNIDIRKEIWLSCSINNDQFGFEIDKKLINIFSNYGYSLAVSGIAYL